jgi:hypothetical protein
MCHHARRLQQLQRCIIVPHAADGDWDMKNADTLDQLIAGLKDLREKQALGLAPPDEEDEEEDEFEDGEEGIDWVWWRADVSADSTASPAPASTAANAAASSMAASTKAASAPTRKRAARAPIASSSDSEQLASSIIAAVGARLTQREAQQGSSTPLQRPSSKAEPGSTAASGQSQQQQGQQDPQQQGQQQPARVEEEQPALPRKTAPAARSQRPPTPGKRSGTKTAAPAGDQAGGSAKQPAAKPGKYSNSKSFLQ